MKGKKNLAGGKSRYLFLLPGLLIYICIIVAPAFYSLFLSLFSWNGVSPVKTFVGVKNYIDIVTKDPVFWVALKNNLIWIVLTFVFTIPTALLFAVTINRKFIGRTFVRGIFYFPYILSGITVAIIWSWVYHPQLGMYVNVMQKMNLPQFAKAWLADPKVAFYAIYVAGFWHVVGQPMILFLSGLQTIPVEMTEAASIDGANKWQNFVHITLPMLKETTFIVIATQIIQSLKVYDIIQGMTGGGPAQKTHTLATWMVTQTFTFNNIGTGTAMAWILVFVCMIVVIPYVAATAKD